MIYKYLPLSSFDRVENQLPLCLCSVVQPMYYYMGHISRYVRPGSKAVHAIVDQSVNGLQSSRTFRRTLSNGESVAGGGINNLARKGIELTLWPCEGKNNELQTSLYF